MTRLLCIGDVHIHTTNIPVIEDFLTRIEEIIMSNDDIDAVVLMGDILHTHERLHTSAFNMATHVFKTISRLLPLYVLVGNHDYINNSQFQSDNHWMNCFKNFSARSDERITIIDRSTSLLINKTRIAMCPYVPDGRFIEALNNIPDWKTYQLILAHQALDGAKMGAIVCEGVEKWDLDYPLVVSGHIHDKQWVQPNLYYTGSSLQHAFGESHDKTIADITITNGEVKVNEINLGLRQKRILYVDTEDLTSLDNTEWREDSEYRVTIQGSAEEFARFKKSQRYKRLSERGIKIVFKHRRGYIEERKSVTQTCHQTERFTDILARLLSDDSQLFELYSMLLK
jgi:DNA repair exonuclease SbcCD nuclease subunit